ncbi:hypothetical protein RI129_006561 [Pyrocoelia pectoralis]|uniref:Uncharacterized protein n=1 Tax=Pyrocoelia pectoralis TaxID=417401 RepID=A0AAN7ZPN2_9COLE
MAKRQSIQKERNEQEVDQHRRRSSQFLTGTRVPNSTIKLEVLNRDNAHTRSETTRRERNEFFEKLMKQLRLPESHSIASLIDTNIAQVSSGPISQERRELMKETESKPMLERSSPNKEELTSAKRDLSPAFKKKRRISFRTSTLDLRDGEKRPTYESVQTTIQNSAIIQEVLNVDYDGQQQLKKVHLRASRQEPL